MLICVTSLCSVNCSKTPCTPRFRNNLGRRHVCFQAALMSLEAGNSPLPDMSPLCTTQNFNYLLDAHKLVNDLRFMGSLNTKIRYLGQVQKNKYHIMFSCCFVWVYNLANWSQGMLATIRCRIFCFEVCCPKIWKLRYTEIWFCLLFCMGVKLGRWHWGRVVGWGCLRMECWGEYMWLRWIR